MNSGTQNDPFISFWNDVLVTKFEHFRNILMEGMSFHSDSALNSLRFEPDANILDVGCGWGDTALALARKLGSEGSVLGIDCCDGFLQKGRDDARNEGIEHVQFIAADVQTCAFEPRYDFCFSRFGVMFFSNAVAAMRNIHRALKPGGEIMFIAWRTLDENPWLSAGKETVLRFLPPPGADAKVCGPGPFSMAERDTVFAQMRAAGFVDMCATPVDGPVMAGVDLEQAVEFQLAIGPAGEIVREAGALAHKQRAEIAHALRQKLAAYQTSNGSIVMPSASWIYSARKPDSDKHDIEA